MNDSEFFVRALRKAITEQAKEIASQIEKEAKEQFEIRMKAAVAKIVLNIANEYDVSSDRTHLLIRVKHEGEGK